MGAEEGTKAPENMLTDKTREEDARLEMILVEA